MSRRQSLDRPGILSPPGPFLTPSPSPSISASPRLQLSPSLSPFPQDVLLVTGNPLTNNSTHEQERKTVTPGRRQSIHQFTNGSPSAGTVVFQPSPSQSPAAATSVIGVTGGGSGLNVVAGFPNSVSQNTITTTLPTITTTGNELNTTLVGSNNIQLNKKGTKRQQQQNQQQQQQHHQIFSSSSHYSHLPSLSTTTTIAGGYGQLHATTINNTPNTFATTTVASAPKNQTKKGAANSATVLPIGQQSQQTQQQQLQNHQPQQQQQQFQQYQTSSPLIADSPSPSPSGTAITSASIKPPTPQPPMQMLQQQFTIASNGNGAGGPQQQTFQLIQGPQGQLIAAATSQQQNQHLQQQQLQQHRFNPTPTTNIVTSTAAAVGSKSTKAPQQILPKPQQLQQQQLIQQQQLVDQINFAQQQQKSKTPNPTPPPAPVTSSSNMSQPSLTQISQSAQPGQQQQIILPSGATASLTTTAQQPLLLNQVPVLVQQNTPQGVQLILRPPTPQLTATPSLVIQNRAQPQLQQHQQPQQVLRILGTNGATMQLAAATPTFIVSSQANLIQQANHLQTIKTQSQSPAITQLSGLHAALSAAAAANSQQQRSQQFATTAATINGHLLSPSVAAQIQNLQLAAAAAANGNGLTAQIQMPNGLTTSGATTLLSQLPGTAQFQQNSQGFNINLNQLSGANIQQIAAAAAAGATFQTPPPPPQTQNAANNGQQQNQQNSGNNTTANNNTATNDLFSNSSNAMSNLTQSSPAHCPVAVTPEPIRQPTPVLQNIPAASPQLQQTHNPPQIQLSLNAAATIQLQQHQQQQQQAQIQQLQQQIQQTQNQVQQAQQQQAHQIPQVQHIQQNQQSLPQPQTQPPQVVQQETKKKPKPRRKKPPAASAPLNAAAANNNKSLTTTANKSLNTNTSTTSVLAPTITSTSNTINMVPNATSQEQLNQQQTTNTPPLNHINQNLQNNTAPVQSSPPSPPPPQIQRASNGKLDLGNVMKLCGITDEDDEDFMDTSPNEETSPNQSLNSTQNFTISIPQPNGTSETLPYTLSIPGVQSTPNNPNETLESSQEPATNIVIKIDPSDAGIGATTNSSSLAQPYSITIPRLPSQEEIQKQSQQHLNNQQNDNNTIQLKQPQTMLTSQPLNTNITFSMPMHSAAASMAPNSIPQLMSNTLAPSNTINNIVASSTMATTTTTTTTATVKPRRKPAAKRNNKKDANNANAISINSSLGNSMNSTQTVATSSTVVTPAVNITTSAISTPLATPALVPSQIGNIQISQIDNRLGSNQTQLISTPMTSLVENKIQIMPIMDKNTNAPQMPQLQQTQIVFQPNNTSNNLTIGAPQSQQPLTQEQPRQMQLVALPQLSNSSQASTTSTSTINQQQPLSQPTLTMPSPQINTPLSNAPSNTQTSIMPPAPQTTMLPGISGNVSISVGTPNTIAGIIPQLTGSLTLAVSEQCERLILRHDPNQPQDQQSQLILQALLKGALPNVTIINEPTKIEPPKPPTIQQQPTLPQPMLTPTSVATSTTSSPNNSTGAISKSNKKNNKQNTEAAKQQLTQNLANQIQKPVEGIGNSSSTSNSNLNSNLNSNINTNINMSSANMQIPPPNVTMSQQRYIALPKIDPSTQQLFSLNPLNNQITPINANQTTASIGPTERLLIAPAGINAQQLAQCLQQGQLHFNDVNPVTSQQASSTQPQQQQQQQTMGTIGGGSSNQQPKQQIVYPMTSQVNSQGMVTTTTTTTTTTSNPTTVSSSTQPATTATTTTSTTTKQVANVAPIIDQSKAKQDTKQINNTGTASTGAVPKKKPVRKPKASTTTAADVALMKNASVVKPMPKLDPLSQKPNNNPVQIVQPNTASGKPVVSTSTTSTTTTTTSNVVTIQPFQTQTSTGTKLVGVTAPMQQQPQNNLQQQQQQTQQGRTQTNFSLNFAGGTNNNATTTNTTTSLNTNQSIQNLNNGLPNNTTTSTNQPQHTVSRVQTIQLTPQQQQMFKQVQMQIQYLTVKLQHKNLLSSMPLPADLDPNVVAAFNKPMNDIEINTALQRLFMEQQRILAAGKEIPTPEPFITNATNAANAANNFPLMPPNNFTNDSGKVNSVNIPANIVLPNNHSTLSATSNIAGNTINSTIGNIQQQQQQQPTQKIHIYPIQHQQQQQNKQTKQTKQQQISLNINNINTNNTNSNLTTPTSIAAVTSTAAGNSGNSKVANKQKLNQSQQQQQQIIAQPSQNSNNLTPVTTNLVNPPTLNLQLPQLSSLTTTPSLPSLPYPSLPPPHMINIANMPAVLQQKHFTQHLQMQQQQLMQQQQQQQKLQNSNTKPSNNFATFNANLSNMPGFQQGPPPLIFPTSTTTTSNAVVTMAATSTPTTSLSTLPQLTALSQQQATLPQQQTQIHFQPSTIQSAPTFAVTIGNQKTYVPIITGAIASVTSSTLQQVSLATSSSMNTMVSALPQLITATAATSSTLTTTAAPATSAAPSVLVPTSTAAIANAGSINPMLTLKPPSSSGHPLNNSIVVQQNTLFNGGVNVNIVGNPIAQNQTVVKTEEQISPKAKLARLSLFLRQLEVDQQSCLNPDYKSPFENKEEAVKRLIRYHCMYQTDEDIPSEEEEEFEKTAIRFQDKFRHLSGKFQQILLQESMLQHRTSEMCQMEKLMIDDLRQEIEDSKQLEKDILEYELLQQQKQQQPEDKKETLKEIENSAVTNISQPSPCASPPSIFDQIKNEVKSEQLDIKINLEEHSNNDSNSNFCKNLQSSSVSLDSIKNEIKGEPCDNSLTSSSGVKSSCSSMDSFDLLKQSSIDNSSIKKQTVEMKEPKKEEISTQWKQSYLDSKSSNSYYNHLANASVNINKPVNHVFNGVVKKQQQTAAATPTAVATATNVELKKEEKDSFENFDIESEITPSFIMKKQEPKEPAQTTMTTTAATTTVATDSTTNANTNTSATTKHHSAKPAKQAKISHTFDHSVHVPASITNTQSFQHTLSTTNTTAQPEVVANNFDFSHHLPVNQGTTSKQEDDWLCIQKELNLMNSVSSSVNNKNPENNTNNSTPQNTTEPLAKTLDFLSNATSNDLFPNGCINKTMENQCNNQVQTNLGATNCQSTLATSSCSQQNQQPSLPLATHEENQQAADLNEFFSGSEDSEVQKDVETRLEAMFGESPVHLAGANKERSDSPDDIESGLESIFGESNKSPSNNHCAAKEKSNWDTDFGGNSFMTSNQQHSTNFMNATNNSMSHHIQLGSANNPRWMQNMEAQFPDFLTSNNSNNNSAVNDCLASRKRQWNGHIVDENADHVQQQREQQQQQHVPQDEESPQKKMCDGSLNNGGVNDSSASSSSPLGMPQQSQAHHHHNLVPNDTSHAQELMDAALLSLHDGLGVDNNAQENPSQTNGFAHMMGHQNFASYNNHMDNNQQQQTQHFMNLAHQQNMTAQQQQMLNNHMMQMNHQQQGNMHGHHHAGTGEFDDEITRHVQNAIDSILNLQGSEADSLSFSLDHSMGSFLGDTILNDQQSGANNAVSCQESTKRRQLVDELGDCLMGNSSTETPLLMDTSGATAHTQIMNHSSLHHNNLQQQHHGHVAATTNSVGQTNDSSAMNSHHQHHSNNATGGNNISVNHAQQQLNDFNCVVGGIDDAVKSIMTS